MSSKESRPDKPSGSPDSANKILNSTPKDIPPANPESTKIVTNTSSSVIPSNTKAISPKFEEELVNKIVARCGNKVEIIYARPSRLKIRVQPEDILQIASFIKGVLGFDHAESVSGTDYPKDNQIEVVYHLGSYTVEDLIPKILALSTRTNRDDARLPSLINIFKSVEYHERETFEMLGVYFEGHPRMERFLLPEDWADIPPLRKDFRIKGR